MTAIGAREIEIVPVQEGEAAWNDVVRGSGEGTVSHLWEWRVIMQEVLGHECRYLAAVDREGRWRGVLPLVRMRTRLLGQHLVSMPFLNDGGPIGAPEAQSRLLTRAVGLARELGVDQLELRPRHAVAGTLRPARPKVSVHLALPASTAALWKTTFPSKLRSQIRRPLKEGMEARVGSEQLHPFYEVFARNMRDLGTPVLSRRFFEALARVFPEQVVFAAVYHRERPVAGACGLRCREELEVTWASSLRAYNRFAPNMLLYASLMEYAIGQGASVLNFGRCTPGGGTHRFKLQWGGRELALPWLHWSRRSGGAASAPDRGAARLVTTGWQWLPLPLANRIGPVLARQIPWL